MKFVKLRAPRYMEVSDPAKSVGLWSHHVYNITSLKPVGETLNAVTPFLKDDFERWETFEEAKSALAAKGWEKSPARALGEYEAQFHGRNTPRWLRAWHGFSTWLTDIKTTKRQNAVRLSFGSPSTGKKCNERNLRTGRVFFLKENLCGRISYFVAVMLKSGWDSWLLIEGAHGPMRGPAMQRLVLDPRGGMRWVDLSAELIRSLVAGRRLCLFELAPDTLFCAVTDPLLNPDERYAHISGDFDFLMSPCCGHAQNISLKWAVTFNPGRAKFPGVEKNVVRTLELALERGKPWANRPVEVSDLSCVTDAARKVAMTNGCAVLPADAPETLRLALMHELFFVTFPDRRPDEPGGILRGYQMPGRMLTKATGPLRADNTEAIARLSRSRAAARTTAKRVLVVDTLLARAARAVAMRNAISEDDARRRIELCGGRELMESAAWGRGMMEGNALAMFSPKPNAGSLKLPDHSLALAFEYELGLDGGSGTALVQTERIVPLSETVGSMRHTEPGLFRVRRLWRPMPGLEGALLKFEHGSERILRDAGRYFILAFPKYASRRRHESDLSFVDGEGSVAVSAFRFKSERGERSREDVRLVREILDWQKVVDLAQEGRAALYAVDFGSLTDLADATYITANTDPCRFAATVPQLVTEDGRIAGVNGEESFAKMAFIVNPAVPRDYRKRNGRSLAGYLRAYPDERERNVVEFDRSDPRGSLLKCVQTDAVLAASKEDLPAALESASYVVVPGKAPYEPGGLYAGYMLRDRVFLDDTMEVADLQHPVRTSRAKGRMLVETVDPGRAEELERTFAELVEKYIPPAQPKSRGRAARRMNIAQRHSAMIAREFRRIVRTGTMDVRRQLARPAREVAIAIWLTSIDSMSERAGKGTST